MFTEEVPNSLPGAKKAIGHALQFQEKEPIVALYCGIRAAELGLAESRKSSDPKINKWLESLIADIEKEKVRLSQGQEGSFKNNAKERIKTFSLRVFAAAEINKNSGELAASVVKLFTTSAFLLSLLDIFGEIEEDIRDKILYSKVQAVEIAKKIKQQSPWSGGGEKGQDSSISEEPRGDSSEAELEKSTREDLENKSTTESAQVEIPDIRTPSPTANMSPLSLNKTTSPLKFNTSISFEKHKNLVDILKLSERYARNAISAIQFEDVDTAISCLESALNSLRSTKK